MRELREDAMKMTREEFKPHVGASLSTIANWEKGYKIKKDRLPKLISLAEKYGAKELAEGFAALSRGEDPVKLTAADVLSVVRSEIRSLRADLAPLVEAAKRQLKQKR